MPRGMFTRFKCPVCGDEGSEESGMFDKALNKNICYTCFKEKYPAEPNYWYDRLGDTKISLNKKLRNEPISVSTDEIERPSNKPIEAVQPSDMPNNVSPPSQPERPSVKPSGDSKHSIKPSTSKEEINDKNRKLAFIAAMLFVPLIAFIAINYHKLSKVVTARQIQQVDAVNDMTSVKYSAFSNVPVFEAVPRNNAIFHAKDKNEYLRFRLEPTWIIAVPAAHPTTSKKSIVREVPKEPENGDEEDDEDTEDIGDDNVQP